MPTLDRPAAAAALSALSLEPTFTVNQIARQTGISAPTLLREFRDYPGTLKIVRPGTDEKRIYTIVRVPQSVLLKWLSARTVPSTLPSAARRKAAR
jgi:AraC-like DNA-binding protein